MATIDDINSTLQNIARQLGAQAQSLANSTPNATASTSPVSFPFNTIGSTGTTVIASVNPARYGLLFHNPGTATIYIYPTAMTTVPTTTTIGGTIAIYGGSTFALPSPLFANTNGGWSAFSITGSSLPFTVVEFL